MSLDEVKAAIDRADEALPVIQALSISRRSRILNDAASRIRENVEELAGTMTDEIGKPIKGSRGEVQRAAQIFELAAVEVKHVFEGEFIPLEAYDYSEWVVCR